MNTTTPVKGQRFSVGLYLVLILACLAIAVFLHACNPVAGGGAVVSDQNDDTQQPDNNANENTEANDNAGPGPGPEPGVDEGEQIGVMKSEDGGETWEFMGHASIPDSTVVPVDPDPVIIDGELVLYFFDINSVRADMTQAGPYKMYRAVAEDPMTFEEPVEIFSTAEEMITDPAVIEMPDGDFRMYISAGSKVPSALSEDAIEFTQDEGYRSEVGGVPGIIRLTDGSYRLFVCGTGGIISLISEDGLEFTEEEGVRISQTDGGLVCDPDPIIFGDGSCMMVFKTRPQGDQTPMRDEVILATSDDCLDWETDYEGIVLGSVPGLVEMPDGTLYIYFVDFNDQQVE